MHVNDPPLRTTETLSSMSSRNGGHQAAIFTTCVDAGVGAENNS